MKQFERSKWAKSFEFGDLSGAEERSSVFLEKVFEIGHRLFATVSRGARSRAGSEIVTAIGTVLVQDPLRIRFPAFVVRGWIVVCTIQTDVEIGSTAVASVPETDRFAGCQGNLSLAGLTQHPASVLQNR